MNILTAKLKNQIINCFDGKYDKETLKTWMDKSILLCPVCNKPYEYCHGRVVSPYFRHKDKTVFEYLYSEPETNEHIRGKQALYEWIGKQANVTDVVLEGWIPETKQRPDIMFKYGGEQYVIEYQCSPIASEYLKRHELYQACGIKDIWLLGTDKYNVEIDNGQVIHSKRLKEIEKHTDLFFNYNNSTVIFNKNLFKDKIKLNLSDADDYYTCNLKFINFIKGKIEIDIPKLIKYDSQKLGQKLKLYFIIEKFFYDTLPDKNIYRYFNIKTLWNFKRFSYNQLKIWAYKKINHKKHEIKQEELKQKITNHYHIVADKINSKLKSNKILNNYLDYLLQQEFNLNTRVRYVSMGWYKSFVMTVECELRFKNAHMASAYFSFEINNTFNEDTVVNNIIARCEKYLANNVIFYKTDEINTLADKLKNRFSMILSRKIKLKSYLYTDKIYNLTINIETNGSNYADNKFFYFNNNGLIKEHYDDTLLTSFDSEDEVFQTIMKKVSSHVRHLNLQGISKSAKSRKTNRAEVE